MSNGEVVSAPPDKRSVTPIGASAGTNGGSSPNDKTRSVSEWRLIALAGYCVIGLTFGVGGVWAAVAQLDKAVIGSGYVATETNRKTVEHYEGGIIREVLVKEGDHVTEGQVLFRLQRVLAEANSETVQNQLDSALAL